MTDNTDLIADLHAVIAVHPPHCDCDGCKVMRRAAVALAAHDTLIACLRTMPNPFEHVADHGRYWGADTVLDEIRDLIEVTE